jgi:Zn-dependent peptidase ImmA (M78 family)
MATKKQTKTKKEKQATVVQNHQNPEVLRDMYKKKGMSAGAIGRHFDVSRAMILYRLKKCGIDVSKTRKEKSKNAKSNYLNKTWLTNQLKKGISIFAIAKQQGVSYASVSRQAHKLVPAHIIEEGRKARMQKRQKPKTDIPSLELAYSFKNKYLDADTDTKQIMLRMMFRTIYAGKFPLKHHPELGFVVPSIKDDKPNYSKCLAFVWNEPFRTLFDDKLMEEIKKIEEQRGKNQNWYARQDSNLRPSDS